MKTWDQNDLPECLIGYNGQFASTAWYKCLCEHFSISFNVGTHYRGLKRYKNCFAASDAVTWLLQELSTKKFKSPMNRNGAVKVLGMMHKIHQVFEDVRGEAYDLETFSDNSRLFRFKEYSVGFQNHVELSQQVRQPSSQVDNVSPPATPPPLVKSFGKSTPPVDESMRNTSTRTPFGSLLNHRSYEDLPKTNQVKVKVKSVSPNILSSSSTSAESRHEKSLSLLMFNRVQRSKQVGRQSRRDVHSPSIGCNPLPGNSHESKLPNDEFSRTFELFPAKNRVPKNDGLMGFAEALDICSSNNNHADDDDGGADDDDTGDSKSIQKTTKPQNNKGLKYINKENNNPAVTSGHETKPKKVYRRSVSTEKSKKRNEVTNGEESNKKGVIADNYYKISLIVSLCKKLGVENISRVMSVDWIDPSIVKKNITSGEEWLSFNMEFTSKKDFPENICSMLNKISSWPLKTYCKFRVGAERCDASVQSMFEVVLNYLELNPDNIFPVHFQQLLPVIHDLCRASKMEDIDLDDASPRDDALDLSLISQSNSSHNDINQEEKRREGHEKKNGKNGRSRCINMRAADSENKVAWSTDLAKVSSDRHPRCLESLNQQFHMLAPKEDVGLPPNKAMQSKSGSVYFYREFPQMMDLPGWRSNCSTLETGKKRKDDLIIENNAVHGLPLSQIPSASLYNLPADHLMVNKNIDVGEVDEHQFVEVLQLSFLLLGRPERRNFFRLFSFVESIISNRGICPFVEMMNPGCGSFGRCNDEKHGRSGHAGARLCGHLQILCRQFQEGLENTSAH